MLVSRKVMSKARPEVARSRIERDMEMKVQGDDEVKKILARENSLRFFSFLASRKLVQFCRRPYPPNVYRHANFR